MGRTKFAVPDVAAFEQAMMVACEDDEERGLVYILALTGMHPSSLCRLNPGSLVRRGGVAYLAWQRPKTKKNLEALVPREGEPLVIRFLAMKRKSRQWCDVMLKAIGSRCGYPDTSGGTFRHNYCKKLIDRGTPLAVIPTKMGCSLDVAIRNYAKQAEYEDYVATK
jgi:integrase